MLPTPAVCFVSLVVFYVASTHGHNSRRTKRTARETDYKNLKCTTRRAGVIKRTRKKHKMISEPWAVQKTSDDFGRDSYMLYFPDTILAAQEEHVKRHPCEEECFVSFLVGGTGVKARRPASSNLFCVFVKIIFADFDIWDPWHSVNNRDCGRRQNSAMFALKGRTASVLGMMTLRCAVSATVPSLRPSPRGVNTACQRIVKSVGAAPKPSEAGDYQDTYQIRQTTTVKKYGTSKSNHSPIWVQEM